MGPSGLAALTTLILTLPAVAGPGDEPLYGRVTTDDGEVIEGFIRWDRNEAALGDFLDGLKQIPTEDIRVAERLDPDFAARQREARSIVAFGMRIRWDEDDHSDPPASRAAIRFAHLTSIVVVDGRTARLHLTSGDSATFRSSSSDLGNGMRPIEIVEPDGSERTVRWRELDRVDFTPAPAGSRRPDASRIHGTLATWEDLELTGAIAWDLDEILSADILDGRSEGEDFEIPFREIEALEWESDRSTRVVLRSGETLLLRGTNDVDRGNRGIEVSDPAFGRAIVRWEDFQRVRFHDAPESAVSAPDFVPGDPIRGTVHAVDGRVLEGTLRWNNDAARQWEALRGWHEDAQVTIEFGRIESIRKDADDRLEVTLVDGSAFLLDDSDSVNRELGSRGVFVTPDGRATRLVLWRDLDRIELSR